MMQRIRNVGPLSPAVKFEVSSSFTDGLRNMAGSTVRATGSDEVAMAVGVCCQRDG